MLAEAVSRCFTRFTGLPAGMGRWDGIWWHWEGMVPLPSLHDVECWKLDREDLGRVYEMDLEKAVQEWAGDVGAFP